MCLSRASSLARLQTSHKGYAAADSIDACATKFSQSHAHVCPVQPMYQDPKQAAEAAAAAAQHAQQLAAHAAFLSQQNGAYAPVGSAQPPQMVRLLDVWDVCSEYDV